MSTQRSSTIGRRWAMFAALAAFAGLTACSKPDVVIYCALDQEFSKPFIEEFEKETGLVVEARYDTEANKSVGLTTTLRDEKDYPRADVFWNNESANTIQLKQLGVLAPYESPNAADIPEQWKDPEGYWTGFAARARILIVNSEKLGDREMPDSMDAFLDPAFKGEAAVAMPLAGTTRSHFTALFHVLGEEAAREWLNGIVQNGVQTPSGNAQLARDVADGKITYGFTDTDDFQVQLDKGKPVKRVFPDQGEGQPGTMIIPNTVAMIQGAPHPENAKKLIDYILRRQTEEALAKGRSAQIPVRDDVPRPEYVIKLGDIRPMKVDWAKAAAELDARQTELRDIFAGN
ncbi:MAG: extracellular solute-binding protein [Planctomycetota bacterium]